MDLPSRRGGNKDLDLVKAGAMVEDISTRFKDEVHVRQSLQKQAHDTSTALSQEIQEGEYAEEQSPTEPDRYLRNDFSSLRALSAQSRRSNITKNGNISTRRRISISKALFSRKIEHRDFYAKYAPPAGVDEAVLQHTLNHAAVRAGHKSGMLFTTSKKKWNDRRGRAADYEHGAKQSNGHIGMYGLVRGTATEEGEQQSKKSKRIRSPDETQQDYANELLHRLRRLATDTLQPSNEEDICPTRQLLG